MRLVIQRVKEASVRIDNKEYSSIKKGLLCFVGFSDSDTNDDILWGLNKILKLKLFTNSQSIEEVGGELLIVSQFTLFASIKKGTKPSWSRAAKPVVAKDLYNNFINMSKKTSKNNIKTGIFGADMDVQLINDGPLTLIIDTKQRE